jgi:hypothetical protein
MCIRYRGNVSTEPLPSNDKGDTHTQTATRSHEPTLFFPNKEITLIKREILWLFAVILGSVQVKLSLGLID